MNSSADIVDAVEIREVAHTPRGLDWLNPVLIRECVRAFKGNSFLILFMLLIVAAWVPTAISTVMASSFEDSWRYGEDYASGMAWVYAFLLIMAMLVVAPLYAYASMANELQHNTMELLSISTLSPAAIVRGKLGSSMAVSFAFFTAIAPCLTLTLVLASYSFVDLFWFLALTAILSYLLCCLGLLLGSLARGLAVQITLAVLLAPALFVAAMIYSGFCAFHADMQGGFVLLYSTSFDLAVAFLAVAFAGGAAATAGAAAQLTFQASGHAAVVRVRLLLLAGATMLAIVLSLNTTDAGQNPMPAFWIAIASWGWLLIGAALCCEQDELSERVRRWLPRRSLARAAVAWLIPGGAAGHMFACNVVIGATLLAGLIDVFSPSGTKWNGHLLAAATLNAGTLIFLLSVTRYVVRAIAPAAAVFRYAAALATLVGAVILFVVIPITVIVAGIRSTSVTPGSVGDFMVPLLIWGLSGEGLSGPVNAGSNPTMVFAVVATAAAFFVTLPLIAQFARVLRSPSVETPEAVRDADRRRQQPEPPPDPLAD